MALGSLSNHSLHLLVQQINQMSRQQCIDALAGFEDIPLDFDRDWLGRMSIETLRHTLMAAHVTVARRQAVA